MKTKSLKSNQLAKDVLNLAQKHKLSNARFLPNDNSENQVIVCNGSAYLYRQTAPTWVKLTK